MEGTARAIACAVARGDGVAVGTLVGRRIEMRIEREIRAALRKADPPVGEGAGHE